MTRPAAPRSWACPLAKAETLEGDTSSVSPRTQHVIAFGRPTDGGLTVVQSVEELRRGPGGLEAYQGQEGLQDEGAGREVGEGLKGP